MTSAARRPRPRSPRPPTLPATLLRDAVGRALATTSLRQAAREIGLSPNALRNFLAGAEPRIRTRARIERWLAARRVEEGRAPSVGNLVQLIGELSRELSPAQSAALGRETAHFLLEAYQARRVAPPRWVRELARHYKARPD
jgi:ADP-ribose pyrophosphatase YjhB (NUDIX family)